MRRPPTVVRVDPADEKQGARAWAYAPLTSRWPKERRPWEALTEALRESAKPRPARRQFVAKKLEEQKKYEGKEKSEEYLKPIATWDGSETDPSQPKLRPIV